MRPNPLTNVNKLNIIDHSQGSAILNSLTGIKNEAVRDVTTYQLFIDETSSKRLLLVKNSFETVETFENYVPLKRL